MQFFLNYYLTTLEMYNGLSQVDCIKPEGFCLFDLILYVPFNNLSVVSGEAQNQPLGPESSTLPLSHCTLSNQKEESISIHRVKPFWLFEDCSLLMEPFQFLNSPYN